MNQDRLVRQNLEIKAKLPDRANTLQAALRLGAEFNATLIQTDTYFRVPHGRLKLREIEGEHSELIFYDRPDVLDAKTIILTKDALPALEARLS